MLLCAHKMNGITDSIHYLHNILEIRGTAFSCALHALYEGYEMETVETIETLARKLAEAQKSREDTKKYEGNKLSPAYKAACKAVVDARAAYRAFECDRKTRRIAERDAFTAVFGAKDALEELLDTQTASAYV